MRLNASPMLVLKQRAIDAVNNHFDSISLRRSHRDHAHRRKHEIAKHVLNSGVKIVPDAFAQEASLRGLPPEEFARDIIAKPDPIDARELKRQKFMFAIDAAKTPAEIDAILSEIA